MMGLYDDPNDDEDDLAVSGTASDLASQLAVLQGDLARSQERGRQLRQQQLQQATEALRARRIGPSLSEQLFALSAAFAAPRHTRGFGATLANVMPVLGQTAAARRQAGQLRDDAMLELQQKYASNAVDDEQEAIKDRIGLARVMATAMKPAKARTGFNPVTGRLYDMDTGSEIPLGGAAGTGAVESKTVNGKTYYRVNDKWFALGEGGPTGSPPSGGFRP